MTGREEARAILRLVREDLLAGMGLIERQLTILQTRAQALMGLAGVVVTVTGFSGRLIAGRDPLAQALIVLGVALVLTSAVYLFFKVMRIRWISQRLGEAPETALTQMIALRDEKTRAYTRGGAILSAGFLLYGLALAILLLNPEPVDLIPR